MSKYIENIFLKWQSLSEQMLLEQRSFMKYYILTILLLISSLHADYEYVDHYTDISNLKIDNYGFGCYLDKIFTDKIDRSQVNYILEIGSRDCVDALRLCQYYRSHVWAFECNPAAIPNCIDNIGNNPNVTLVPYAAWNENGTIPFYPIITNIYNNIGASSCYKGQKGSSHEFIPQSEITVDAIRVDDYLKSNNINRIDLVCIDAQGATYNIIEGMGDFLKDIKYIICEVSNRPIYDGEKLLPDIKSLMEQNGFALVVSPDPSSEWGDALFVK